LGIEVKKWARKHFFLSNQHFKHRAPGEEDPEFVPYSKWLNLTCQCVQQPVLLKVL